MKKSIKVWWRYTLNSFQQTIVNRTLMSILMTGKILRIIIFLAFLNFFLQGIKGIGGYSRDQIIFFYLSFNLIDTLAQFFFREVYRFRDLVISGNFDFVLLKPLNPLVRVLLGGGDLMDLMMLILIGGLTVWFGVINLHADLWHWIFYIALVLNGLLIATAFHIFVLGLGIMTTSIDHLIMVYRDFGTMLRIPVDLYTEPLRAFLTFVLPLGIMFTFPAKQLMGLLSPSLIATAVVFSFMSVLLALRFWSYALKQYSSASS